MVRRTFEDAATAGRRYVIGKTADAETLEDDILQAMAENPYTSEKARKNFIEGASRYVNQAAERRNRRMNEKH